MQNISIYTKKLLQNQLIILVLDIFYIFALLKQTLATLVKVYIKS